VCAVLLERVFLRLGSAETDEQLEAALAKFLAPVLLKLASQTDGVRKKVTCTVCDDDKEVIVSSRVTKVSNYILEFYF